MTPFLPIPAINLLAPMLLLICLLMLVIRYLSINVKLIPTLFQYTCEGLVKFIFNLVKQQIGQAGYVYFPLIFTLFVFILLMNLFSLMPFGLALTSHIIMIF